MKNEIKNNIDLERARLIMEIIKNKEYIVEIVDNGFEGEGIAKIEGCTVFIPNTIKGEKVKIVIVKVNKNFAYGKVLEILQASESRINNDCETYKQCGGCSLRHLEYNATLKLKKGIVENCLYKALKRKIKVNDVIGMENPYFYRNKLIFPVGTDKNGKAIMGVFANRTHNIVEVKKCMIQDEKTQEIANTILDIINDFKILPYNEENRTGNVRHIIIRTGKATNEMMVILVCNEKKQHKEFEKGLVEILIKKYPNIKSIVKNINDKNTNVIMGSENINLYGNGYIEDMLDGYKFKISPLSFYQVNPLQTIKLYNTALNFGNLTKEDVVLDLYCGIGTISIFLANYVKKVIGIEIIEDAIKDAKENAKLNNIENIDFYVGDVERCLLEILKKEDKANIIFVDPPRKGLDNITIENIKKIKPKRIVYISCNPATLARDITLLEDVYDIKEVQPVDMFCYTSHVECVVVLSQKQN